MAKKSKLRPFKAGERRENPDGTHSTEVSTTWQLPDGQWVNAPSLWMGEGGPVQFEPDDENQILGAVNEWEAGGGAAFPRFKTLEEAETAAQNRSAAGGVESGKAIGMFDYPEMAGRKQMPRGAFMPQGGILGEGVAQPQGMFGRAFQGLSGFNENHPGLLLAAGDMLRGEDPSESVRWGMLTRATRKKEAAAAGEKQKKEKLTRDWLIRVRGLSPEDADAAMADPVIMSAYMKSKEAGDEKFYGNTLFVEDEDGNIVPGQLSNRGQFKPTDLGDYKLAPPTRTFSTKTEQLTVDNWGNVIARQPIENYQEAFQSGKGAADAKAQSEAQQALPGVAGMAGLIDSQIQGLKNDPYLPNMVGPVNSRLPNVSADAARVQAKIDQLNGGAFLQARQMLKGGGAITDIEGQKAEAAFVRMNQAQDVNDFKAALDEFNAAVQQGLRKLEAQAGQPPPAATGGAGDYKQKYGLE